MVFLGTLLFISFYPSMPLTFWGHSQVSTNYYLNNLFTLVQIWSVGKFCTPTYTGNPLIELNKTRQPYYQSGDVCYLQNAQVSAFTGYKDTKMQKFIYNSALFLFLFYFFK